MTQFELYPVWLRRNWHTKSIKIVEKLYCYDRAELQDFEPWQQICGRQDNPSENLPTIQTSVAAQTANKANSQMNLTG